MLAELSASLVLYASRDLEKNTKRSKFTGVIIQSKFTGLKNVLLALMGFSVDCLLGADSPSKVFIVPTKVSLCHGAKFGSWSFLGIDMHDHL